MIARNDYYQPSNEESEVIPGRDKAAWYFCPPDDYQLTTARNHGMKPGDVLRLNRWAVIRVDRVTLTTMETTMLRWWQPTTWRYRLGWLVEDIIDQPAVQRWALRAIPLVIMLWVWLLFEIITWLI